MKWLQGVFAKLFQDLSGDWSSGLLVKALAFLFALELGILCVVFKVDLASSVAVVGALMALVTAFQWVQSATGLGTGQTVVPPPAPGAVVQVTPLGLMAGVDGTPDAGRWIKFLSFLAGVAVLHVAVISVQAQVMNALGLAGVFFAVATGTEIQQKVTGT